MNAANITSLTGDDTIVFNNRVISAFGDGDCGHFTFDNDKVAMKIGKNGNAIYARNAPGQQMKIQLRILIGSADDKFFNSLMAQQDDDLASFSPLTGSLTKRIGDGAGNISSVVYPFTGGVFQKNVGADTVAEGNTDQSIAVYDFFTRLEPARMVI